MHSKDWRLSNPETKPLSTHKHSENQNLHYQIDCGFSEITGIYDQIIADFTVAMCSVYSLIVLQNQNKIMKATQFCPHQRS